MITRENPTQQVLSYLERQPFFAQLVTDESSTLFLYIQFLFETRHLLDSLIESD